MKIQEDESVYTHTFVCVAASLVSGRVKEILWNVEEEGRTEAVGQQWQSEGCGGYRPVTVRNLSRLDCRRPRIYRVFSDVAEHGSDQPPYSEQLSQRRPWCDGNSGTFSNPGDAATRRTISATVADESTSSSSSSSSDDEDFEERQALCEAFFRETFSESHRERPKILGFIENVARLYTDEQFRQDFRVSRRVAETLIRGFEGSRHYPCSDRGGSPSKTAEEHILVFLW
ncbi:hypothetical protein HPB51_011410 [Rhipicephalus microplus]|uniref:Uncharacterized protein n=1 Tax=Rhipicephalus microplus TaxID=6941 RepID=A0A9J6F1B9_RHIMP|nr:hypothetical protein HPB51_011410 [Rhipicephalus microplus]